MQATTATQLKVAIASRDAERVEFLRELVSLPSVTGGEAAIQGRIEQAFAEAGLQVRRQQIDADRVAHHLPAAREESFEGRPNILGTMAGTGGGRSLLLNGHVDTVLPGDDSEWRHPAYSAALVDGEVWGRGACDMKAGLVACLYALIAVRDVGLALRGDVVIAATVGEETGGAGAIACAMAGLRMDAAIVTEPTRLAISPAHAGATAVRITLNGRRAHACLRDEGVSAIEKFVTLFAALGEYEASRNSAIDHELFRNILRPLPVNVGIVRGGESPTIVPSELSAHVRIGIAPGEEIDDVRREFAEHIRRWAASDDWMSDHEPSLEWTGVAFGSSEVPPDHPIVLAAGNAYREFLDESPRLAGMTYGTDMTHFNRIAGIPTILFGPGNMALAHRANERIAVDELHAATRVLAGSVAAWTA